MTGVILAACAAVVMAGAGSLWQRQRSRRRLGGHSSALLNLGRAAERGGYPAGRSPATTGAWTAPPAPPPSGPAYPPGAPAYPPGPPGGQPGPPGGQPAAGPAPVPDAPTGGWTAPPPAPPSLQFTTRGFGGGRPPGERRRPRPVFALAGLGGVAAVAVAALIVVAATSGSHTARRAATTRPAAPTTAPSATTPSTTVPSATTTAPAPAAPGDPVLSSISPSSGAPGQTVTLTGSNLFSQSGLITVTFAGVQAGVSCPSSTTCVVTVPSGITPSPSIPVVINTGTGSSPPVSFTYP